MGGKRKLKYGVALNDADYQISKLIQGKKVICPYYNVWDKMLKRCYSKSSLKSKPSYVGCKVCEEWLTFSNFKAWMEGKDWEDRELDKDILGNGKIYSPETCIFITPRLNRFLTNSKSSRGDYRIGVDYVEEYGKYRSRCSNPFSKGKWFSLGLYLTEEEAYRAWLVKKLELCDQLLLSKDILNEKILFKVKEKVISYE